MWLPVDMQEKCSNTPDRDNVNPGQGGCRYRMMHDMTFKHIV